MRRAGIRTAIVLGTLSVIAAGVLVGVRATAAPRIGSSRDYSCSSGDYTGTITIKWYARTSESIAGVDSVAGIWYRVKVAGGIKHSLKKTIPFTSDGHAEIQVVDDAVLPDPENDIRTDASRSMVFETEEDEGEQDGDQYELTGPYFRHLHGGPLRFSFRFATGGATPDNDECIVKLSNVQSNRELAGGGEYLTYGCEEADFAGSIRIEHDGWELEGAPENESHIIKSVEYKIDPGGNKAGDEAKVRVDDHHPEALPVFVTKKGIQDNGWHEFDQSKQHPGGYIRGRTTDESLHKVVISFTFDRRAKFGFVGARNPKCTMTLPDWP